MAIRRRRGRPPHPDVLTPAEWRVADAVRHGMRNRTIARLRGISGNAVKFHLGNIRDKLGLRSREALRFWRGVPRAQASPGRLEEERHVSTLQLGEIGQIARSVRDLPRAEAWYRDVLGLPHLYTFGKLAFFDCGGTRLLIEDRSIIEDPNLHNDSVLYFRVPDIDTAYDTLRQRGVEFVGAPHMIHRHADGLEEWMAFFRDPDGGLLALMAQKRVQE
jgi:DNA-binding CsgD family transcriptional regulator/catechol 2,3-dioxygenase-like lactoylglutathione lyase family enzyme